MRIVLATDTYLPIRTATAAQVFALRTTLAAEQHRVHVLAPQSHTLYLHDKALHAVPSLPFPGERGHLIFPGLSQAEQLIERADVVHVHTHGPLGRWAAAQAQTHHRPLVISIHAEVLRQRGGVHAFAALGSQAAAILVPTDRVAQALRAAGVARPVLPLPPLVEAAFVAPRHGQVVRDRLGLDAQTPLCMVSGRLAEDQRHDVLIRAVASLTDPVHLMLLGSGPAESSLRLLSNTLHVGNRVHLLGEIPHAQLPMYLAATQVFLTASPDDPAPLSLAEAQTAGCPVIVVATTATRELVRDHATGLLVRPTKTSVATALRQLIHRPALRHRLGAAARQAAAAYAPEAITNRVLEAYALARSLVTPAR